MRNALSGYTYQHQVTLLLLSIMDVERNISKLEIEAKSSDNFDDLILTTNSENYQLQIKDFENVLVSELKIEKGKIFIKGKPHKLSNSHNVIFFKHIDIKPNQKFLRFPSCGLHKNVSLVSLSRVRIDTEIGKLYKENPQRQNEIDSFFNSILDKRIWEIPIEALPQLKIFITELQEKSISISHKLLEFENLLFIEGKPGIGKSHFFIKSGLKYQRIDLEDILYIEGMSNYVIVHTQHKKYITYLTFGGLLEKLPSNHFIRIHKSYAVSLKKIDSVDTNEVKMGSIHLPLSKFFKEAVMSIISERLFRR